MSARPTQHDLSGTVAVVTGGAGTIGSHVVDLLLQEGVERVIVIDNLERGSRGNLPDDARVHFVEGDIRDRALVRSCLQGADTVFHLAALRITQCAAEPWTAHDVLATGTVTVALEAIAAGVRKVIASSSASVYGQADVFPTREDHHPWSNNTLYGAAKAYNEGVLRALHSTHDLDYVALRYFNVIGPRMDAHGKYTEVLIRWMNLLQEGSPPLVLGDGSQTMDFVDVRDVARANIAAARSAVSDRAYNIASGRETSLVELAALLAEVMGASDREPRFGPERAVNAVRRRLADTSAAEQDLGFRVEFELRQTLEDLVAWWRSDLVSKPGEQSLALDHGGPRR